MTRRKKQGSNLQGDKTKQAGGSKASRRSKLASTSQVGSAGDAAAASGLSRERGCGWEFFCQQYGLDSTFDEAFARWLDAECHDYGPPFSDPEPERPVTQRLQEQLGLDKLPEKRNGTRRSKTVGLSDRIPTQEEYEENVLYLLLDHPTVSSSGGLDADLACYRAAIEPIRSAIAAALEMLKEHEVQRGRRLPFRPDPICALLIMRDILARALPKVEPSALFRTADPKKRMVLRDELIRLLLRRRIPPRQISEFLQEHGYWKEESNERVINTVAFRLRAMGHSIPPSPTARNWRRKKNHNPS